MRIALLMAASGMCLLGCATPQDRALAQQAEVERMVATYGPTCTQMGFTPNTDPWRNCILKASGPDGGARGGVSTSIGLGVGSGGRGGLGIGFGIGR